MSLKQALSGGLVAGFAAFLYFILVDYIFPWVYLIIPGADAWRDPSGSWYFWLFVVLVVVHILYALVYTVVKENVPGTGLSKGFVYGVMIFLISTTPHGLLLFNLVDVSWFVLLFILGKGLIINVIAGMLLASFIKE